MSKKKTTEEVINDANTVHNYFYDYSLLDYVNALTKVKIICPIHGVFEQKPITHIRGCGCPSCKGNNSSLLYRKTTEEFIKDARIIHDDKYDYSLVEYINNRTKIKIICHKHGVFEQSPKEHLKGCGGCVKCYGEKITITKSKGNDSFKIDANRTHNNFYNYSLVEYINSHKKVKIICPKHGVFEQKPNSHLNGHGCPKCKMSKGEKIITDYLNDFNIKYYTQKKFNKCKNKSYLPFDFYLTEYNTCIEYDGKQHFIINEFFGGKEVFLKLKKHDNIKTEYCKNNNIDLLRIRYDENIEEKLISFLKEKGII